MGKGAYGKVFLAKCHETGEKYACKSIPKALFTGEDESNDRIRREVEVGLVLRNAPGVVALHETYEDGDNIHVVFELCGENMMRSLIREGTLSEQMAAKCASQMLRCVDTCHQHGVVHRDVKPSNFLWKVENSEKRLKLADFGQSTFWQLKIDMQTRMARQPSSTATFWRRLHRDVGTGSFAAPEVMAPDGSYGPRCDVWSVGAIAYMSLFGKPPFFTKDIEEVRRRVQHDDLDFTAEVNGKQISTDAQRFLTSTLQRSVELRVSAEEALEHPWIKMGESSGESLCV